MKRSILVFCIVLLSAVHSFAQQAAAKSGITYLQDSISSFEQITARFKNQIIYVDMWATWCSPCRQELQQKQKIKDFAAYAGKHHIAVVYICYDRNNKSWKQYLTQNGLYGYHLLVTPALDKELHEKFSFWEGPEGKKRKRFGLPRHLIIDQHGTVVDSLADSQGSKQLYEKLNGLLAGK